MVVGRTARAARRAVDAGRLDEARASLGRWLRVRPGAAEAYFLQARVALAEGNMQEVSEALKQALKLGYPREELVRFDALVKSRMGNYAEAEPVLARLFEESTRPDPEVDEALARVYLQTYRLDQAAKVLDRWMRDAPRDPKPYLWYTEIDSRTTSDFTAVQEDHYRAALERDPNLDRARLGLADLLQKGRRHAEAAREYDLYLAHNPKDATGFVGAARNALGQGDEAAAIGYLDRALAIAPKDPSALKERAGIDQRRGDYPAALERLNQARTADPYDTEVLYARSLVLARLGRSDEAKADQRRMNQIKEDQARLLKIRDGLVEDPNNLGLRYEIAKWMFEHGREEEGVRWARYVLALQPHYGPANRLMVDYHERRGESGLANYYRLQAGSDASSGTP
jgi:Flp pilus assembly protein TadD